jgi:hypothetical protein
MIAKINLNCAREITIACIRSEYDPSFNQSLYVNGAIVDDESRIVFVDVELVYRGFTAETVIPVSFSFWIQEEAQYREF